MSKKFTFPVGYHDFHKEQIFNFQLNRWYSFGYARFEDMQEAGGKIGSFADWKREMTQLAEKAVNGGVSCGWQEERHHRHVRGIRFVYRGVLLLDKILCRPRLQGDCLRRSG